MLKAVNNFNKIITQQVMEYIHLFNAVEWYFGTKKYFFYDVKLLPLQMKK